MVHSHRADNMLNSNRCFEKQLKNQFLVHTPPLFKPDNKSIYYDNLITKLSLKNESWYYKKILSRYIIPISWFFNLTAT